MNPNKKVIQSFVYHCEKCFFVSTIERDSSAVLAPGRYNETIVWEYDDEKRERGAMLYTGGCITGSIRTHIEICKTIYDTGKMPED